MATYENREQVLAKKPTIFLTNYPMIAKEFAIQWQ